MAYQNRSIKFETSLIRDIQTVAEQQDRSFSSVVRTAAREYVEKNKKRE